MSARRPVEGAMLLDTASIRAMGQEDLDFILRIADSRHPDRRDAQRTIHRGLDAGKLTLDRDLRIVMASDGPHDGSNRSADGRTSGEGKENMNARELLGYEPRLGDNPSLTPQPSIETIVRAHYERIAGKEQGDILADMYLEKVREAASAPAAPSADVLPPRAGPDVLDGATDPHLVVDTVSDLVRRAVISHRRPQTRQQIVELIVAGVADGSVFARAPDLRRTYANNGLVGSREDAGALIDYLASGGALQQVGDGYVARVQKVQEGDAESGASRPGDSARRAERPDTEAPKPRTPGADPFFAGLGAILGDIDVDLKVGGVDLMSGIEKATRTGNPAPLLTGIASIVLGAVAAADAKK